MHEQREGVYGIYMIIVSVTPKIGPPTKIGSPDQFWQKFVKSGTPQTNLAAKSGPLAKNSPPRGTKFGKHIYTCQNRSPKQN